MALEMNFKDQYGNVQEKSYWRLVQCNISVPDKNALLVFYGYKDKEAREEAMQPIAAKQYTIMGEQFDKFYNAHLEENGPNIGKAAYQYAVDCADAIIDDKTIESFFKAAVTA